MVYFRKLFVAQRKLSLSIFPAMCFPVFRLIVLSIALVLATSFESRADVWRVDNNPENVADSRTIQEAHDRAVAGDTIYVAGSPTAYPGFTMNKLLVVIGPGYFHRENPQTPASSTPAFIGNSTVTTGAEGATFMGLTFSSSFVIGATGVTVTRCRSTSNVYVDAADVSIQANYLDDLYVRAGNGSVVSNNHVDYLYAYRNSSNTLIINNVIRRYLQVENSTVQNNILVSGSFRPDETTRYSHNLGSGTQFGTENGNQSNVGMTAVFVDPETSSTDGRWQLAPNSVAIDAGSNGEDCGMFDGARPYVLSGVPPIPSITEFSAAASGSAASGLPVRLQVRANP